MKNAIILCSGGLDSVVTCHLARSKGYKDIIILFFNYNQKSLEAERKASKECARSLGAQFKEINLEWLGGISGALINKKGKVKKLGRKDLRDTREESKNWYVPCRNTIFLVYSLALAESIFIKDKKKFDIFVGFKNEGKEAFPDTTPEFLKKMNELSKISTKGFKILAPLIEMDKEDIILAGKRLDVDFKKTFSCYVGKKKHCGACLSCMLRKEGFYWSNIKDPTDYC